MPSRVRVVTVAHGLDADVRDALIRAVHQHDAWGALLPVLDGLEVDQVVHLLDVPALGEPGVRERLTEVVVASGDPATRAVLEAVTPRLRH